MHVHISGDIDEIRQVTFCNNHIHDQIWKSTTLPLTLQLWHYKAPIKFTAAVIYHELPEIHISVCIIVRHSSSDELGHG